MTEAGLFHVEGAEEALYLLAEATLVIVLFSDAAAVDLQGTCCCDITAVQVGKTASLLKTCGRTYWLQRSVVQIRT